MIRFFGAAILAGLSIFAAGCSVTPPESVPANRTCNFVMYPINVPIPALGDDGADGEYGKQYAERVGEALRDGGSMLFLSGGSQNGAFGAGFLHGWAERNGGELPDFQVVSGISTGAILATWAFVSESQAPVEAYAISHERQLLRPFVRRNGGGNVSLLGYVNALRRGAFADLAPLRVQLLDFLDNEVATPRSAAAAGASEVQRRTVIEEAAHLSSPAGGNRLLVVGVVDVDTGQAYALDLGEMAERYVAAARANDAAGRDEAISCYVDAIVASSSVPLAALPVFIDNRMMIDGGARFGMFSENVLANLPDHKKHSTNQASLYVIANGDLETSPACGEGSRPQRVRTREGLRLRRRDCTVPTGSGSETTRHRDWDLLELAGRSEQILVNQVYRFSADRIISRQKENPIAFARIRTDAQNHLATIESPELVGNVPHSRTCREWWQQDEDELRPLQFYPRYMRCLIDYGRARGRRWDWDLDSRPPEQPQPSEPAPGTPPPPEKPAAATPPPDGAGSAG